MGCTYRAEVAAGVSDARHYREVGVPVVGFSPVRRSPVLLHADDEFIPVEVFLDGIQRYEVLISALANLI